MTQDEQNLANPANEDGESYEAPEVEDFGEVHELTLPGKAPAGGDVFQQAGAGTSGMHPPTPPHPHG